VRLAEGEDPMSDAAAVTDGPVSDDGPEVIRDVADQIIKRHAIYGALGGLLPCQSSTWR
jgi:hypothetical protein